MPQVCRALVGQEGELPPSSKSLLTDFIGQLADHLVRAAVTVDEVARPQPRRTRSLPPRGREHASIHDQWVAALGSSDGAMRGDSKDLETFACQLNEWRRPLSVSERAPFRLCFRLEEPEDGEGDDRIAFGASGASAVNESSVTSGTWYVRYLLQSADDQSLLIPAASAWEASAKERSLLAHEGFDARAHLLTSLGQASRLCPRIDMSLRSRVPEGYATDATGAFEFLSEKALELEQAGFVVLLPAWWTGRGAKKGLSVRARVKSPKMAGGGFSLQNLAQFDWEVALGGEEITLAELRALAAMKAPLVKMRGQWMQVSAEEIQAALRLWKNKPVMKATIGDVVRMALGTAQTPGDLPFEGVRAEGWIAGLLDDLEGRTAFEELDVPEGFDGTLRPYQVRGFSWLSFLGRWGLGACLADDMGLGKTVQVLALAQLNRCSGENRPILVVCPTSVVANWEKEAARFTADLPVMVHHGTRRARGDTFGKKAARHAIVVSSYGLLRRDLKALSQVDWSGVVLDEAQNIKNPETGQAKAARSLNCDFRAALTGTPVENNIGDLWSIMEFLNPGFLGSASEFRRRFFIPIQANLDLGASDRLRRMTAPFILRRLKTDKSIIADLPEKMEMKVFCTLTREQATLYEAVAEESLREIDDTEGIGRRGLVLATLTRLKQVCNHPRQLLADNSNIPGRSGKLARLTEMLEEIFLEGEKALVFTQYAVMGDIVKTHLQETFGREVLFLHGGVPRGKRERMIERFQSDGDGDGPSVFVLSLKAGGTGLNLTGANHVFHFDRWWNPAVEDQATDRAFRIGQKKNVQVHKFLCAGTLEEKIDAMIEHKKEVAELVVSAGEQWLTELSNEELREMITLGAEALAE
jgi:superfamily II DNA or RNA helicase